MKGVFENIREFIPTLIWLFSWYILATVSQQLALAIVPIGAMIQKSRGKDLEVLIGFMFLLILSDSRQPVFEFAKNAKNIYILVLTMFYMMDRRNSDVEIGLHRRFIPFLLFAFFCLLFSPEPFVGAQKTLSYLLLILVVPNMIANLLYSNPERTIKGLTTLFLFVLFTGIAIRFVNPAMVTLEGRFTGLFGNPNGLGIYGSILFAFFSILLDRYPGIIGKTTKYLVFIGIIISILLCGSRNALFAVMLFVFFRNIYNISPYIGFAIFLILIASFTYILNNLVDIIIGLGLEEYFRIETLEGGSGRTIAWDFALEKIDEEPWIGKGFSYTEYLFKENYTYLSMLGHQGNAHNSYLTIWLDTGLIGLLFFLSAFAGAFIRASKASRLAIPALYLLFFSANFESWLAASLNPVTILVWSMLAVMLLERDDEEYLDDSIDVDDEEDDEEPPPFQPYKRRLNPYA